ERHADADAEADRGEEEQAIPDGGRPGREAAALGRQPRQLHEHDEHQRRRQHLAVDRIPAERAVADGRRSPQGGAEGGEGQAGGEIRQEAEEEEHVQQVRQQHGPEVELGSQPEEAVAGVEDEIAQEEVVASERPQDEAQEAVVADAGEADEVVGPEVGARDRKVDPGGEGQGDDERRGGSRPPVRGLHAHFARERTTPSVSLRSARPARRSTSRCASVYDVAAITWKRLSGLMAKASSATSYAVHGRFRITSSMVSLRTRWKSISWLARRRWSS